MSKPEPVIVDESDNVIGSASFQVAADDELIRRIVRIALFNSKNLVLLQQRAAIKNFPNLWDFAAAGHVDANESYIAAAAREMKEEIGLTLKEEDFQEYAYFLSDGEIIGSDGKPRIYRAWAKSYIAHGEGPFNLQKDEVQKIKWITQADLANWVKDEPEAFMRGFHDSYDRLGEVYPNGYRV